ncbi:M23 family metallopeptidase [Fulvivirga maritima]|uniref:M23 family metallopeptidase n=1 Tax=Fulvivirga maritima TaxID=2904247 RepID=UPI001F247E51|nr:M23 family metallopeptidase [Fulvivirga maritima]UII28971.1 M23 family metallopeptidase [Fulvivirga maritima]
MIAQEDEDGEWDLESLKEQKLNSIKDQVGKLMFWKEAAGLTYYPPMDLPTPKKIKPKGIKELGFGTDDPEVQNAAAGKSSNANATTTQSATNDTETLTQPEVSEEKEASKTQEQPQEQKQQEVKPPERTFPCTDQVWHFHPIAFVEHMKRIYPQSKVSSNIIFPCKSVPLNHPKGFKSNSYKNYDYTLETSNPATFAAKRGSNRLHAARDLYYEVGEPIYAMADGKVIEVKSFYNDTFEITIEHDYEIVKGFKMIVRYGEVNKNNILVKVGDTVKKGQHIAKVGLLIPYVHQPAGEKRGMLHLEMYTGELSSSPYPGDVLYNKMKYARSKFYNGNQSFRRREDLIDPLDILNSTLQQQLSLINKNYTIDDAEKALKHIYDKYGEEMSIIIERMYRDETAHFTSLQYRKTGTGGMEAHGAAPYYGWSSNFFTLNPDFEPIGLTSFFEGKGKSGLGGNQQVKNRKKHFIVMPSVIAAMEYKAYYIKKYNGDYARWHSTEETAKKAYQKYLEKISPKFTIKFNQ